ncbi:MAG TPA: hypothetical protein EYI81_02615 [Gammaproteobacteria bacterium]|nr:hypothetical protein [Gammaproteobacteria bacterium]
MKILLIIFLTLFSLNSFSSETEINSLDLKANSIKLSGIQYWSNKKVILSGFEDNFSQVELQSTSPILISEVRQKKFPFASQYSVSFLNEDHQLLYQVPLGDPFNLYAEHFGYEGKKSVIPIRNPYVEVPIPASIDPVFVRLDIKSKDEIKLGEELIIYRR